MSSITQKLKIAGFLLNIAEWDRHLEVTRQILNGIVSFEPYAAFLRLTRGKSNGLTSRDIESFMRENGSTIDPFSIDNVVRVYDTKFQGFLDFEDFLKMTLARDNPKTRFEAAATREIYDVGSDSLAEEIEYTLNRFFTKACEFVKRLKADAESQSIVSERDLFNQLGTGNGALDFKILKKYFEDLRIVPRDSEMIAILRVIDINDDGIIDRPEFEYFLSLFNSKHPSDHLLQKLKERVRRDDTNYFGERKREGQTGHASVRDRSSNRDVGTSSKERSYVSELRYESKGNVSLKAASPISEKSSYTRVTGSGRPVDERIVSSTTYVKQSSPVREELRSKRDLTDSYSTRERDQDRTKLSGDGAGRSFVYEKSTTITSGERPLDRNEYVRTSQVDSRLTNSPHSRPSERKYEYNGEGKSATKRHTTIIRSRSGSRGADGTSNSPTKSRRVESRVTTYDRPADSKSTYDRERKVTYEDQTKPGQVTEEFVTRTVTGSRPAATTSVYERSSANKARPAGTSSYTSVRHEQTYSPSKDRSAERSRTKL